MAAGRIISCPECHKKFKGKGDLEGKKIRCPFCKAPFKVMPLTEEKAAAAKAGAASRAADDDEGEDGANPYGITELDLAPRCPNCANEMESEEAVVCLYCGYNTLTRTWGKTEKVYAATFRDYFMHLLPGMLCVLGIVLLVCGMLYYCLVFPTIPKWEYIEFLDHESMRMWSAALVLFASWGAGYFAFNRLILHPQPPDKYKD